MLKKICKAKLELNEIINKKTKFLVQRLRWQEFEYGNKSGQFLANQLKINKEKTTICAVKDLNNTVKQHFQGLLQIFIFSTDKSI